MSNETELEEGDQVGTASATEATGPGLRDEPGASYAGDLSWSPGMMLKRAREQQKTTREDLSVQTKLSVATVRALEEDDFDTLSEPVYTRGYYRRCANVLNLSSAELVKAYERASGDPPPRPQPLKPSYGQEELRTSRRWMPYLLFLVAAACLVALVMWWMQHSRPSMAPRVGTSTLQQNSVPATADDGGSGTAQAMPVASTQSGGLSATPSTGQDASESSSSAIPPPTPVAASSQSAVSSAGSPASTSSGAAEQPQAVASPTQSQTPTQPSSPVAGQVATAAGVGSASSGAHALKLAFKQKSWVEVTDASGKTLLSGLMNGGAQKSVHGKPPYDVLLGYAPGVKLSYGGQAVPLSAHVRSNNTAHLTVGQSQ